MDIENKVDMSLDDIIKMEKKAKQQASKQNRGRGRGNARGGFSQGQRGAGSAGRGRGAAGKGFVSNMRGVNRLAARGSGRGGVGRGRGGRGRGAQNAGVAVSPLNRNTNIATRGARGRGRGARGMSRTRTFTNSNASGNIQQDARRQRLNVVKTQAALLRKKEMAVKSLQTAKKTMQEINQALQKTSRSNLVNQKRGLPPTNEFQQPRGRGRRLLSGRGRGQQNFKGSTTSLVSNNLGQQMANFKGSTMSLASNSSGRRTANFKGSNRNLSQNNSNRHLFHTSVTIPNQGAQVAQGPAKRKRQWRANKNSDVTIQVANEMGNRQSSSPQKKTNLLEQLKMLKPAVPTTYKFQKNVFSSNTTTLSLNDRFSSTPSSSVQDSAPLEGRKVFI